MTKFKRFAHSVFAGVPIAALITLAVLMLAVWLVACGKPPIPPPPPPPPPPPTCGDNEELVDGECVCIDGYERNDEGICVEIPPPPPPSGADPTDYYKLSVGANIINDVRVDSRSDIYVGIWTSVRNLWNCANDCPDLIEPTFGITPRDLIEIGNEGEYLLDRFEDHWRENFSTENWRATEHPEFEGRSNVRREYWRPFEDRLRAQRAWVSQLNGIAGALPIRETCAFDNIQGWCGCMNREPQ